MTDSEDTLDRADREKRMIENAERDQWNSFAERLERLRPLRDRFASEVGERDRIVEILQNAQSEDGALCKLGKLGGYAQRDLVAACMRVQRLTALRVADLERELADLRSAQQPADPPGAHPYRSPVISATAKPRDRVYVPADHPDYPYAVAPSSPEATSEAPGRPETRPGALRRAYGALASEWPALAIAAGFSYASGVAFPLSPAASGALAGVAICALVRAGVWGSVR